MAHNLKSLTVEAPSCAEGQQCGSLGGRVGGGAMVSGICDQEGLPDTASLVPSLQQEQRAVLGAPARPVSLSRHLFPLHSTRSQS